MAFNAFTLTRLPQLQDQHLEFFPLVLVALDRLLVEPRLGRSLKLAFWYVMQALTGNYLLVFTAISIVAAFFARSGEWAKANGRAVLPWVVLAGGASMIMLIPVLLPYYYVSRVEGLSRSLDETATYSAHLTTYLSAAGTIHFDLWSRPFFKGDALFPGLTALLLAGTAIAGGVAIRDRRARMALAIGIVGFALSFGPAFPVYRWLYAVFPLMSGIRGAVRFGQLALVAIGLLAGFGLHAIASRLGRRGAAALSAALLFAVNLEAWRAPLGYARYRGIPPVYDALSKFGNRAVLVWMPFFPSHQYQLNVPFMLVSTRSWQRMLNGYSAIKPGSYHRHAAALADFPDEPSITYLQNVGVTHILVDGRNMRPEQLQRLSQFPALQFLLTDGNLSIYLLGGR